MTPDLLTELAQYRRLFNNIPAEIGVFDLEGRFLFNTPTGMPDPRMREWILGKTHHDNCSERGYPWPLQTSGDLPESRLRGCTQR